MVVNFTTYAGLAKPTESELALNWTRVQDLQEDNNVLIQNLGNADLQSYTPTFTSAGSAPGVGSGSITGDYRDLNGFIMGSFRVTIGTAPTVGTGIYAFSLPFEADPVFHAIAPSINSTPGDYDIVGTGYLFDSSAVTTSGGVALDIVTVTGVSYVRYLVTTFAGKSSYAYSPGVPFTIADGDVFSGSFAYKSL